MKTIGIDEAGRGPVVGSMFIAGFMADDEDLKKIQNMGLKDSKKLNDSKRKQLRQQLENIGSYHVEEITASEIDRLRKIKSLNVIEIENFAKVIDKMNPDKAIVDLPEPNSERFIRKLRDELEGSSEIQIIAEHEADSKYPVVSAASILAKSEREKHVERLKQKYNFDIKSGYPHDQETRDFLAEYLEENGSFPEETRESWSTAKKIKSEHQQKTL